MGRKERQGDGGKAWVGTSRKGTVNRHGKERQAKERRKDIGKYDRQRKVQ
jgi:hypothetical protein